MKADMWKSITDKVNPIGVAKRTTGEIKDKWRTMVFSAKKDFSCIKQQQQPEADVHWRL